MRTTTGKKSKGILALDPATKCGWAHSNGHSGVLNLKARRDEGGGGRLVKLSEALTQLWINYDIDLVVFEAARHAAPRMQGALCVIAELQAVIKLWCELRCVPYKGYSPATIKKLATGKGNANKQMMLNAARKRWPNKVIEDDNEADALWLLEVSKRDASAGCSKLR